MAGWRWVYLKRYTQGGEYLIRHSMLTILLFIRELSKVTFWTPTNSRWHSAFVSLRPLASWCTTGTVLLWLLTNIRETLMTDSHLNGLKLWKQSVGSGRVALSCWRWCFTLRETSLKIAGYRRESRLGAAPCRWVTPSEGEQPLKRHSKIPAWCLLTSTRPRPYFDPISPRNTRRHKPRASDLSAEESQRLRKSLNEGSPLLSTRRLEQTTTPIHVDLYNK